MRGSGLWVVAGVALGVVAGAPGLAKAAEAPPMGFTWYVLNQLNEFYFDIEDPTNRPPLVTEVPAGVLEPVNINDDGVVDWLINWPDGAPFCGTGGCRRSIYVSDDGGYRRVFDRQAWDLTIGKVAGETRIEASFHHLNCTPQREDCRLAWAWDPKAAALTERPSRDGHHILTSLDGPPLDLGEKDGEPILPDHTPEVLYALFQDGARVCPVADPGEVARTSWPALRSLPDLNGDGVRDWIIDAPVACGPEEPAAYGYQVWVSTPADAAGQGALGQGSGVTLAWTGPVDHWPQLDVGQTPARLIDAPLCDHGEGCPGTPLTWDAAAGVFRR